MNCPTCGSPDPAEKWCMFTQRTSQDPKGFHTPTSFGCVPCEDTFHNQVLDSEAREQILSKEH